MPHNFNNLQQQLNLLSKEGTICEDTASKYFKLSSKNLTSAQMIHLLETLSNLLKSGFTLLESFEFINLYFKYRDKELKIKS